jgi:hypothetical protein
MERDLEAKRAEERRPVEEAGGGEAEGFEQAEAELVEQAENPDEHRSPERDAFTGEKEADRSTASYSEPDEVNSTEVTSDPDEDDNDPGAGPGLAPER